jgi:hypothetical protein
MANVYTPINTQYTPQQQQQPKAVNAVNAVPLPPSQPHNVGAKPFFGGQYRPENFIRNNMCPNCLVPATGAAVPAHWYDGGDGWVTKYFTDVEPFDYKRKVAGTHRCTLPGHDGRQCEFAATGEECCCACCWMSKGRAPAKMRAHLAASHGIAEPPKRQWASGYCDCAGICDAALCWCVQGSRQLQAGYGAADAPHWLWCALCVLTNAHYGIFWSAWYNRHVIKHLNRVDEACPATMAMACCCPVCSHAQSYREFSAAGVFPGGTLVGERPAAAMKSPPPTMRVV